MTQSQYIFRMKHIDIRNKKNKNYSRFRDTIKYLPKKDMKILLDHISTKDNINRTRNKLMFRLLLSTGCRVSEFLHIQTNDINYDLSIINIRRENTKSNMGRSVRVKKELLLDLRDYLTHNNIKNGYIFRNKRTLEPLQARGIRFILNNYTKDLGLSFRPSPHTFRHCHCIYALSEGVSINALQKQVGHINIETTQIYSNIAGVELIESYKEVSF